MIVEIHQITPIFTFFIKILKIRLQYISEVYKNVWNIFTSSLSLEDINLNIILE